MDVFESYHSYRNFIFSILREYRYIPNIRTQQFLQTILETCDDKIIYLEKNSLLYRSQKGCDQVEHDGQLIILPFQKKRMMPKADKVKNGRVNSIGIPVLYVSDSIDTAIAETRPWIDERVSVVCLKLKRNLRILDLSHYEKKTLLFLSEPTDKEVINKNVWADISNAFSVPVNIEDQEMQYIPTQVIGEYLKSHRFDGIKYKSLLASGNNFAIFDTFCTEIISGKVFSVNSVKVETEQVGNDVEYQNNGDKIVYSYITDFSKVDNK